MARKVIVYEDDPVLCKRLEEVFFAIRDQYQLLTTFPEATGILQQYEELHPDAILLDIQMLHEDDGLIALYQIKQQVPGLRVLMLTMFDDDDKVFNAICLGANGYMLKSDFSSYQIPHEALRKSLGILFDDGAYLTPSVAAKILHLFADTGIAEKISALKTRFGQLFHRDATSSTPPSGLSKMQHIVLQKIAEGKTTAVIARECQLSENTINSHIKAVYSTLEVHSRAAAIRKAIENRLIRLNH